MKRPHTPRKTATTFSPAHPYDAAAKQLLAQTPMLAYILKNTTREFQNLSLEQIASACIDANVSTGDTPVHPHAVRAPLTLGLRNEDNSMDEGDLQYDVLFHAQAPGTEAPVGIVVNIEAHSYETPYPLLKRALYYCARLLSAQRGTGPAATDYGELQKVYSIWLITNPPAAERDTVAVYATGETPLRGSIRRKPEAYDLMSAVLVSLPKAGCYNSAEFTEALATLLSPAVDAQRKMRVAEQCIGPELAAGLREELDSMTSLGEWAIEIGVERGMEQGLEQATLHGLRALMRTMSLDANAAMNALEIPQDQRNRYGRLLTCQSSPGSNPPGPSE